MKPYNWVKINFIIINSVDNTDSLDTILIIIGPFQTFCQVLYMASCVYAEFM